MDKLEIETNNDDIVTNYLLINPSELNSNDSSNVWNVEKLNENVILYVTDKNESSETDEVFARQNLDIDLIHECTNIQVLSKSLNHENGMHFIKQEIVREEEEAIPLEFTFQGADEKKKESEANLEIPIEWTETETEYINLNDYAEVVTSYKCKMCSFLAANPEDFIHHIKSHSTIKQIKTNKQIANPSNNLKIDSLPSQQEKILTEKLIIVCAECKQGFENIESCKAHMVRDHAMISQSKTKTSNKGISVLKDIKDRPFSSPESIKERDENCQISKPNSDDKSLNKPNLTKIRKKSKTQRITLNLKCSFCKYKFSSDEAYKNHRSCHGTNSSDNFKCYLCHTEFSKNCWKQCALHLWKCHQVDIDLLPCDIPNCNYRTVTSMCLENHKRIHTDNRPYNCSHCGKSFKQSAQLRNHKVIHLDRKAHTNQQKWYTTKTCTNCGKNYADAKCLRKHIEAVHSKIRPYSCNFCSYTSSRKAMLQIHLRQHTGEKPYQCDLCDYRTADHNSLRRHRMRHTGQRPYQCPHCSYSCIQSISYKNHLRSKHPGMKGSYTCHECGFRTVSEENLLTHLSDHATGIIETKKPGSSDESTESPVEIELFPGNVAAAQLIYRCLNREDAEANVTGTETSEDGNKQTITLQIPATPANKILSEPDSNIEQIKILNTNNITCANEQNSKIISKLITKPVRHKHIVILK